MHGELIHWIVHCIIDCLKTCKIMAGCTAFQFGAGTHLIFLASWRRGPWLRLPQGVPHCEPRGAGPRQLEADRAARGPARGAGGVR